MSTFCLHLNEHSGKRLSFWKRKLQTPACRGAISQQSYVKWHSETKTESEKQQQVRAIETQEIPCHAHA